MNIKPTYNNLLLKPVETDGKTSSGIIVGDTSNDTCIEGFILSTGPEVKDYKVGSRVIFNKFSEKTSKITFNGEDLYIISDKDVLATI